MTHAPSSDSIGDPAGADAVALALALPQRQKVVLVMDLVESVRLMAANEAAVIGHWRRFIHHATTDVLPRRQGRLVKSLGDGFIAVFDSGHQAVAAALELQRHFVPVNAGLPEEQRLYLRGGLNATRVFVDEFDIYGSGVNLAARVASLAGPGEVMVTSEVRDELVEGIDGHIEDMGECYLKHVAHPVRAYRVGDKGPKPVLASTADYLDPLHPTVAVIPFESRSHDADAVAIGDLIADGVIAHLGASATLRIVSRLSSASFSGRGAPPQLIREKLGAAYVLVGSYVASGTAESAPVLIHGALLHSGTGEVIWVDRFSVRSADLCAVESEACMRLAAGVLSAILEREAVAAARQPLPTLASYSLLLSGIRLMHRSTTADMALSRKVLEHLAERHPRHAEPYAWLAKSFVINAVSRSTDWQADAERARDISHHALERFPDNVLALAVQAHVLTHLEGKPELAAEKLDAALQVNRNEPMAWLFKSVLSAMWGDPEAAVEEAVRAHALSPADPLAYYFKMIHAAACTSEQDFAAGTALARESLRLNRNHTPTWRVLITNQVFSGDLEGATASAHEMLRLDPSFSMRAYQASTTAMSRTRKQFIAAAMEVPVLKSAS
ncbi:MAG TPA: adenylate/guanylate cyclase domain-containing protein [Ramlibacter sp.]|uniref:adenylate/guanylate cyclase domain-containing protein n=1 Tax=Ramlibacter sp. TaxID=1917967 RepID=UPI002D800228|nr:adenylate/guanylate cyclase domain-containing protein [Ramlibacter sp.]HET8746286.1 adenylate/guanylate cyclase domain-containing protein [Ramlibacter sp.]